MHNFYRKQWEIKMLILNEHSIKYWCSTDQDSIVSNKLIMHQNVSNIIIWLRYLIINKIKDEI